MLTILFLRPLTWSHQQTIDHQVREQNRAELSGLCTYKTCSSFRPRGIFNQFHRQRDVSVLSQLSRQAIEPLHMPQLMQLMQLNNHSLLLF